MADLLTGLHPTADRPVEQIDLEKVVYSPDSAGRAASVAVDSFSESPR